MATSKFEKDKVEKKSLSEAIEEAKDFDYVRFTVADFYGRGNCRLVPRASLDHAFSHGVGIMAATIGLGLRGEIVLDEKQIPSLASANLGNVVLVPDVKTLTPIPWAGGKNKHRVGQILCETKWAKSGLPQEQCPRFIARKQLKRLKNLGYRLRSGFELELMLTDASGSPVCEHSGHFLKTATWDVYEELFLDIDAALQEMGVRIQSHQVEYAFGQFELALETANGIEAADHLFMTRDACRQMTARSGYLQAVFMSKIGDQLYGNGLHFNHSLCDLDGKMAFYDPDDPDKLSWIARHWIAGLVKHAGALLALNCPTFNCYRRLHMIFLPQRADWGIDNRFTSFRIQNDAPEVTRIECRQTSGAANPYLVMAATLAAGIDGLVNQLACPKQDDPEARPLPESLLDALKELEQDQVLVDALGQEFVSWFCVLKRQVELKALGGTFVEEDTDEELKKEWHYYREI